MPKNVSECYNFTTSQLITYLSVYGATTSIGAVSCLTAIVLIMVAKGYKEFINRLILYMAVDGLISYWLIIADIFERKDNVRHEILHLVVLYLTYTYCFLLCWLGLYLFLLAVFRVQLKKKKHELIGLVSVLATPSIFLWVFIWQTKKSDICEDTFNLNKLILVLLYNVPILCSVLLISIFIGAVLIALCKNAMNRAENTLQQQHRKAVKETIPFVIFVIIHQVSDIITVSILACQVYMAMTNKKTPFFVWEVFKLWPLVLLFLPILLLSQPRIRHRIKCRKSQNHLTTNTEHGTTIHQSTGVSQPSDTHYSVQHESIQSNTSTCGDTSHSHSYVAVSPTDAECERQPLLSNTFIGYSLHPTQ